MGTEKSRNAILIQKVKVNFYNTSQYSNTSLSPVLLNYSKNSSEHLISQ